MIARGSRRKKVNILLARPSLCVRRPSVLAEMAWARWRDGQLDEAASLAPIYLQLPRADPDMKVIIRKMTVEDVPAVSQIDRLSFSLPWPSTPSSMKSPTIA